MNHLRLACLVYIYSSANRCDKIGERSIDFSIPLSFLARSNLTHYQISDSIPSVCQLVWARYFKLLRMLFTVFRYIEPYFFAERNGCFENSISRRRFRPDQLSYRIQARIYHKLDGGF